MFEVNDLVIVKHNGEKHLAVVTKITHESYFQCVAVDGTVFPSVYTGYVLPVGKKYPMSKFLQDMEKEYP